MRLLRDRRAAVAGGAAAIVVALAFGAACGPAAVSPSASPVAATSTPTPTATPDTNVWRVEGVVTDIGGSPLRDVCVVIGPLGCREFSPRTDEKGVFFFDVPKGNTSAYDLFFLKDGFIPERRQVKPTAPGRILFDTPVELARR